MQRVGVAPALEGFSLAGRAFARLHSQQPLLRGIAGFGGDAAAIHRIHPCTYGHVDASASQIPALSHSAVNATARCLWTVFTEMPQRIDTSPWLSPSIRNSTKTCPHRASRPSMDWQ